MTCSCVRPFASFHLTGSPRVALLSLSVASWAKRPGLETIVIGKAHPAPPQGRHGHIEDRQGAGRRHRHGAARIDGAASPFLTSTSLAPKGHRHSKGGAPL